MMKSIYTLLLFLAIGSQLARGQEAVTIVGTVQDSSGTVLPGVSVTVAGKPSQGTTTDEHGKFVLDVLTGAKITVSSVGFQERSVTISPDQKPLTIVLSPSGDNLDEVVITAYGKKERREAVVGSVTSIDPRKLKIPSSNLTNALAGQIAGVVAYQRSGQPGLDNSTFFIRGVTTFGYKQDPLILVDNVELSANDLARLQVDDIASFSILKDASATALYGARGANGVILITTKEGVEGPAKINVRYENSISQATKNLDIADPITYMNMYNDAYTTRNPLQSPRFTQNEILSRQATLAGAPGSNPYVYPAVNWLDMLFKDRTNNQRLNASGSGGGKVARYYIAGSYNLDNGVLKVSPVNNFNNNVKLENYQLRSNININVTPTTEVIVRLSGNFDEYNGPITQDGSFSSDLYSMALHTSPVLFPAYFPPGPNDPTTHLLFGNSTAEGGSGTNVAYINPYAEMMRGFKAFSRSRMSAQFEVNQKLDFVTSGLNFHGIFNTNRYSYFDLTRSYDPFYYTAQNYDRVSNSYNLHLINSNPGQAAEYLTYVPGIKDISTFLYMQGVFDYSRKLGNDHQLSGTLVITRQQTLNANAIDPDTEEPSLQYSLPFRNLGVSGRASYGFKDRYFTEFNFGYNGSERFAEKNRFGFFPTIGGSWVISNEPFWKGGITGIINRLKVRGSYGLVGNDAIGSQRFFYLADVNLQGNHGANFGTDNGVNRPGVDIHSYPNDDVTWETSRQLNLGLETTLLSGLNIIAEVYKQHRYNILMDRTYIPASMGLEAGISANVGTADSKGIDLSADYSKTFSGGFWLSGRGNMTLTENRYGTYEQPAYNEPWRILSGQKIGVRWGKIAERLFVDDEEAASSPTQIFTSGASAPMGGDIKYRDLNGDGRISNGDDVFLGYPETPELVYGAGISAGFKGFDISAFFQGQGRVSFFIDPNKVSPFIDNRQVLQAFADSHWTLENQDLYAKYPRLGYSTNQVDNNMQVSSWWMRDGSFLRLKSMEVGYTIPQKVAQSLHLANCRIYFNGLNLLTFSHFKDWDPELASNGFNYPIQKVFNVGINVNL